MKTLAEEFYEEYKDFPIFDENIKRSTLECIAYEYSAEFVASNDALFIVFSDNSKFGIDDSNQFCVL